jgi:aspartate 1-decarboxylase
MNITLLKSKLHRATVTEANLNYAGSITIDAALMAQAKLFEYEQVHVVDIDNGNRLITYVIKGEAGSGVVCLNGAAARHVQVGDKVIIMSYVSMTPAEAPKHKPAVILLDQNNVSIVNP